MDASNIPENCKDRISMNCSEPITVRSELSQADLAQARSRAYALFGRIFGQGLGEDVLPILAEIPDLAGPLDFDRFDADEAAAVHYHLFGLNVFPYESAFLDGEAKLGGEVSESVLRFYQQGGFVAARSSEGSDHLAIELQFLAFLSEAEGEAIQDGLARVALRIRDLARLFLDEHLLVWLPSLVQAIRQQGDRFYAVLADLTLDLASLHRDDLETVLLASPARFHLPPAPAPIIDDQTSLKAIAGCLVAPALSGIFLSRDDITRLARGQKLPRGFGSRAQMLANLLHAAADYEQFDALLDDLQSLIGAWRQAYSDLQGTGAGRAAAFWLERLAETERMITELRSSS